VRDVKKKKKKLKVLTLHWYDGSLHAFACPSGKEQHSLHCFASPLQLADEQHFALATPQSVPWNPCLQLHWLGPVQIPASMEVHSLSDSQENSVHVAPFHPEEQVHTPGSVHLPPWLQPDWQIGTSQVDPSHPESQVHTPGAVHLPPLLPHPFGQIGTSHLPTGP
jgi:hypothetical protein